MWDISSCYEKFDQHHHSSGEAKLGEVQFTSPGYKNICYGKK